MCIERGSLISVSQKEVVNRILMPMLRDFFLVQSGPKWSKLVQIAQDVQKVVQKISRPASPSNSICNYFLDKQNSLGLMTFEEDKAKYEIVLVMNKLKTMCVGDWSYYYFLFASLLKINHCDNQILRWSLTLCCLIAFLLLKKDDNCKKSIYFVCV